MFIGILYPTAKMKKTNYVDEHKRYYFKRNVFALPSPTKTRNKLNTPLCWQATEWWHSETIDGKPTINTTTSVRKAFMALTTSEHGNGKRWRRARAQRDSKFGQESKLFVADWKAHDTALWWMERKRKREREREIKRNSIVNRQTVDSVFACLMRHVEHINYVWWIFCEQKMSSNNTNGRFEVIGCHMKVFFLFCSCCWSSKWFESSGLWLRRSNAGRVVK